MRAPTEVAVEHRRVYNVFADRTMQTGKITRVAPRLRHRDGLISGWRSSCFSGAMLVGQATTVGEGPGSVIWVWLRLVGPL
jgi:hypothetical protein